MKKIKIILSIAIFAFCGCAFCGCGQDQEEQTTAVAESLTPMGEIKIQCEEIPSEEYQNAKVIASWILGDNEDTGNNKVIVGDDNAEIKLRGNTSKEAVKKAYNIKFQEPVELLGMEEGKKWALVSNPFEKSMLRPAIGFELAAAMSIEYTSEVKLCQVWLNDQWMGVYSVMEPVEAGEGRVEINPEDGDFLLERNINRTEERTTYIESSQGFRFEFNEPEEPEEEQIRECESLLEKAEEAIFTVNHRKYSKYIDVGSFVDFYIFHEFVKDIDFGEYSTRYYFKDGIMYAGPPWDLDFTMGNVAVDKDEDKYRVYNVDGDFYGSTKELWAYSEDYYYTLCQDPWFMDKVAKRWAEVRLVAENLAVDNQLGTNAIDKYMAEYRDILEKDFEIYGRDIHMSEWQKPGKTYMDNVDMLRNWIIKRVEYLDTQFVEK